MSRDDGLRRAVKWSFVMTVGSQGGTVLTTLLLASLLGPEAYGLVALANTYVLLMLVLVDPGLTPAIVQRQDLRDEHLDSAFWTVVAVGLALFAGTLALASSLGTAPERSEFFAVLGWLALRLPLHALSVVQQALLRRSMDFKSLALRANAGVIAGAVAGIAVVFAGGGIWALVAQNLTEALVGLAVLWSASPWRPRLRLRGSALRELAPYSLAVFLSTIGNFVYTRADTAVMGWYFGHGAVGIYRLAVRLMRTCGEVGTRAVSTVALSMLSRYQGEADAFRARALQSLKLASAVTTLLLGSLAAVSTDLFEVLGPKWGAARTPFLVLCVLGATQVLPVMATPMIQALGRPLVTSILAWIWGAIALLAAIAIGVALRDGADSDQVLAICAAHAAVGLVLHVPAYLYLLRHICGVTPLHVVRAMGPPLAAGAIGFGASAALRQLDAFAALPTLVSLAVSGAVAVGCYALVLLSLDGGVRAMVLAFVRRKGPAPAPQPPASPR